MTIPIKTEIIAHNAFIVEHVLSAQESQAWIDEAERVGFQEATVDMPGGHVRRTDIRDNDRVTLDDPIRAAELWTRLQAWCPEEIRSWRAAGLNERLRIYRYSDGQQFNWHRDGTFRETERRRSYLTLLIYLSEDFEGGETSFDGGICVVPRVGMALAFKHAILHKGEPVTQGVKYVLRTDVMYEK